VAAAAGIGKSGERSGWKSGGLFWSEFERERGKTTGLGERVILSRAVLVFPPKGGQWEVEKNKRGR